MYKRRQKLAIIDAHALIHRAYHALPPMNAPDGTPTNAAYGFTTMLLKMLATLKPTHVVATFDVKGPTFRHKQFQEYKANRKPADKDLTVQFSVVKDLVKAFGIPIFEQKGVEADDIIGSLTAQLGDSISKVVVTGDMDTLQLVDPTTHVFTLRKGMSDTVLYDQTLVKEKYGFNPERVVDYKGLRGDPSDNIPGVAGIGDKSATDLIVQYGDIEGIYDHLEEVPKRAKTRLEGHKDDALFSRELATIKRDVDVPFVLGEAAVADFDPQELEALFLKLGFKSLLGKIPKSSRASVQKTLFDHQQDADGDGRIEAAEMPENYHLVESEKDQETLLRLLLQQKVIAFDTENERLGAREWPIIGMSFAAKIEGTVEAWYVPVTQERLSFWKELLESPKVGKVGHNLKYDLEVVRQSGVELQPITFDTMLASYLLDSTRRQHSLDALALTELQHRCISITSLIGSGKNQLSMGEVPLEQLAPYACEDAEISYRLYELFQEKMVEAKLIGVLKDLELPLIPVLADIELAGVKLDTEHLSALKQSAARQISGLEKKIWKLAGGEFNVKSTQQLRTVLYERLRLPTVGISRTQSGWSTAASELDKLRDHHEIIPLLERYRELTKLKNTYIDTLPALVDVGTGRIHGSFNQAVAATGRLSSADPNLQNIPVRTEFGQEIRAAFVAERGMRLVKADYSQLELRIAAHIAKDEKMMAAFLSKADIHQMTAAWVHGVEPEQVTDEQRRQAKALNFGVLYGMGPHSFARTAHVSLEEARSFIERYREQYAGITRYIEETIELAEAQGFVETLFGRRRYVPDIQASSPAVRAAAERAAYNFPIQGTEADLLKKAMIDLSQVIHQKFSEVRMILTVHDELVCEVPVKQVNDFAAEMKDVMESVLELDVPLVVEVGAGKNWRDLVDISE